MSDQDKELFELTDEELLNLPEPTEEYLEHNEDDIKDTDTEELEEDEESEVDLDSESDEDYQDDDDYIEEEDDLEDINFDNIENNEDNDSEVSEKPSEEESSTDKDIDYKEVYDAIFAPFKANGKEIQVKSVDEVISLMQMGANYTKKMVGIKQQLPFIRLLEKNNLLDENKLSYAIDLLNGDKAAIANLLKEHEVDLYDFEDIEEDNEYVPSNKGLTKQEIELSEVLDEIQHSESYDRTLKVATEIFDTDSRNFIVNNPEVLKVLEAHIGAGIFDTIWDEVERLNSLGKLTELNSLEAYKVVGDHLNEQGVFNSNEPKPSKTETNRKKVESTKRKRQAARKPKSNPRANNNNNSIDPLGMSDADFENLMNLENNY